MLLSIHIGYLVIILDDLLSVSTCIIDVGRQSSPDDAIGNLLLYIRTDYALTVFQLHFSRL